MLNSVAGKALVISSTISTFHIPHVAGWRQSLSNLGGYHKNSYYDRKMRFEKAGEELDMLGQNVNTEEEMTL